MDTHKRPAPCSMEYGYPDSLAAACIVLQRALKQPSRIVSFPYQIPWIPSDMSPQ